MTSESTEIYSPHFFLHGDNDIIKIENDLIIGRSSKANFKIQDKLISSSHCQFIVKGIKVFVVDLESTNGTYINDKRIAPGSKIEIKPGDRLKIGPFTYFLKDTDGTERSKNVSYDKSFSINDMVSFFGSDRSWKKSYYGSIIMLIAVYMISFGDLDQLPENLSFLESSYNWSIKKNLAFLFLFFYSTYLGHAFMLTKYLKHSTFFSYFTYFTLFTFQFIILIFTASLSLSSSIQTYSSSRVNLMENSMKRAPSDEIQRFTRVYERIVKSLSDDKASLLSADYHSVKARFPEGSPD